MTKVDNGITWFKVKCIKNEGCALIVGHYYDAFRGQDGVLCVVDEEKEGYIYPDECFEVPPGM